MAYLVVAYPKISEEDFNWIQNYRKENDPRYFSIVEPHFTTVFAVDDIEKEDFIEEVKQRVTNTRQIDFEISEAIINQDYTGEYWHEFLIPKRGNEEIIKLHDSLYSGLFSKYLRSDIPFIPHIGIGNSNDKVVSKDRITALNNNRISIAGEITSITVIEYKDNKVITLNNIPLLN